MLEKASNRGFDFGQSKSFGGETINGGTHVPVTETQTTKDTFNLLSSHDFKIVLLCTQDSVVKRAKNLIFKVKCLYSKNRNGEYINSDIIQQQQQPEREEEEGNERMEEGNENMDEYTTGISTDFYNHNSPVPYGLTWW